MTDDMTINGVIEMCGDRPECVCVEFETEMPLRAGSFVKVDFFGKRIFRIIRAETNEYMKKQKRYSMRASEFGYRRKLLCCNKNINIFDMIGLKISVPTEEEITQAKNNACLF